MEGIDMTQEMRTFLDSVKAMEGVASDQSGVVEKYVKKYGPGNGEASEEELDELMKRFPNL